MNNKLNQHVTFKYLEVNIALKRSSENQHEK